MSALRLAALASMLACARADHADPVPAVPAAPAHAVPAGSNAMTQPQSQLAMTCDAAKLAIETRRFAGWRGLPAGCTSEAVLGLPLDDSWGALPLGASFERARSHLVELAGYGRALAYVRDGTLALFDAMTPSLEGGWHALSSELGPPDATFDWTFGTVAMPAGELVYATRGLSIFLNPENQVVVYLTAYVPTTVDDYAARLRPPREKRPR